MQYGNDSSSAGVLRASVREQLQHVLRSLDEREQDILCRYYGLDGRECVTLEAIGQHMGVTRERILLETLEEILPKVNKVVADTETSKNLLPFLPLNQFQQAAELKKP